MVQKNEWRKQHTLLVFAIKTVIYYHKGFCGRIFIRICIRLWLVVIFCVIQCWIFLSIATCNFCLPFCEVVICLLLFFDNFFSLRICLIPFYLLFYSLRVSFTEKKIICICIRYYAFLKLVYLSDTNYNGCIEVSFW